MEIKIIDGEEWVRSSEVIPGIDIHVSESYFFGLLKKCATE